MSTLDDLDRDPAEGLAALLDEVHGTLEWFVKFPSAEAADAVALYVALTHAASGDALQFAPRLRIKSPQKRCGKTRLLEVATELVADPLTTANISAAALVHSIASPRTIMFDEADAVFGKGLKGDEKAESLRGILNAGFQRNAPYLRWDITTRSLEECPTFALAVIAGIGNLPDTIEDRSVPVSMNRKTKAETCRRKGPHTGCTLVHKYRPRRDQPVLNGLRDRLHDVIVPLAQRIGNAEPDMPEALSDRAEDVFEALVALADLAGRRWPGRARRAAVVLMSEAEKTEDMSLGLLLLSDLREIFSLRDTEGQPERDEHGGRVYRDFIATSVVLTELRKIDESPWRKVAKGEPIDGNLLARLLRDFEVTPKPVKVSGTATRGYRSADLKEAWARYLTPCPRQAEGPQLPVTLLTPQVRPVAGQLWVCP